MFPSKKIRLKQQLPVPVSKGFMFSTWWNVNDLLTLLKGALCETWRYYFYSDIAEDIVDKKRYKLGFSYLNEAIAPMTRPTVLYVVQIKKKLYITPPYCGQLWRTWWRGGQWLPWIWRRRPAPAGRIYAARWRWLCAPGWRPRRYQLKKNWNIFY